MAFSDWLLICGTGLLIKSSIKKSMEEKEEEKREYEEFIENLKKDEEEQKRRCYINNIRKLIICNFKDGITREEFQRIASEASEEVKRIKSISIENAIIKCVVSSQTGCTEWEFSVDFNNWGHITGTHWTLTDNYDSLIPKHYGSIVANKIYKLLEEKNLELNDLSDEVDVNLSLGTDGWEKSVVKKSLLKKILKNDKVINLKYKYNELVGEHLFPVFSIFKNSGFKNITVIPIYDIDDNSLDRYYKVEGIIIDGKVGFNNSELLEGAEIIIKYHYKRKIVLPFNVKIFKRKNYLDLKNNLKALGFSNIDEEKIEDLVTGWITKEGSVEEVLIGDEKEHIKCDKEYFYDDKVTIQYHVKQK